MPGDITIFGPKPPAGYLFCAVCAASFKFAGSRPHAEAMAKMTPDSPDLRLRLDGDPPAVAVAYGLFQPGMPPPAGNGIMPIPLPLCWTHLLMIDFRNSAIIPAHANQIPGAGAVLLDRPRLS